MIIWRPEEETSPAINGPQMATLTFLNVMLSFPSLELGIYKTMLTRTHSIFTGFRSETQLTVALPALSAYRITYYSALTSIIFFIS